MIRIFLFLVGVTHFFSISGTLTHFPCELKSRKDLPELVIFGVNHHSPEDESVRAGLITEAGKGEIFLALEGFHYDNHELLRRELLDFRQIDLKNSRIFGFEDDIVHALALMPTEAALIFQGVNRLYGEEARLSVRKFEFLYTFITDRKREAWHAVQRPLTIKEHEGLAQFIDRVIAIGSDDPKLMTLLVQFRRTHPLWKENQAFVDLSRIVAESMAVLAEKKYKVEKNIPDLTSLYDFLRNPGNLEAESSFLFPIAIHWRNVAVAENLAKIYCKAVEAGKELKVIIGDLHVDGLVDLLRFSEVPLRIGGRTSNP